MTSDDVEETLVSDLASFTHDPLKFVQYSFQWGEGTLAGRTIEDWQKDLLSRVRDGLLTYQEAIKEAVASGHGVGKSALVSWLILWGLSTFEDTRVIVTANTETQLKTKTWAELAKWHSLFIAKEWFEYTATALYSKDPAHEKTWRADMIAWSEHKTEAFAGAHNQGKRLIMIFDEASAIPDSIWEVTEGAFSDEGTELLWFVFGNPTRNTGRFKDCFGKLRHRWHTTQVDSRTVTLSDKKQISQWIEDYGIDSDFVKVRVRGLFPNVSELQFIPTDLVDKAYGRSLAEKEYVHLPKVLVCEPSWTGSDALIIAIRQGQAFRILLKIEKNDDDTRIAGYLMKFEDSEDADAVFIDLGYGTGIYSVGKNLGRNWILVPFGGKSLDAGFLNKRAEMWNAVKQWLKEGGCIPADPELRDDLIGPEYRVRLDGRIVLESKDDMKDRGLPSPNKGDALALTFAHPVVRRDRSIIKAKTTQQRHEDYDPLA